MACRRPGARGQHDQRVEHLLVQADRLDECIVPSFDRGAHAREQRLVELDLVFQVGHAKGDVARLVLSREVGDASGDRVGRVLFEKPEQVQERAFAEHRQQERRQGEVRLLEQGGE